MATNVVPTDGAEPEHPISSWIQSTIVGLVSALIVGSNVINLAVLRITFQLPENARFFLIQLSLSDLIFGLVSCAPCTITSGLGRWIYGPVWCQIAGLMHGTSLTVSMWCITMISIDRYLAVIHPLRYHLLMTARRCRLVFAVFWPLALLTFTVPLALRPGFIYYHYSATEAMCGLHWSFRWFPVVTALYIPIFCGVVMGFTSYKIIRAVVKQRNQLLPVSVGSLDSCFTVDEEPVLDKSVVGGADRLDRSTATGDQHQPATVANEGRALAVVADQRADTTRPGSSSAATTCRRLAMSRRGQKVNEHDKKAYRVFGFTMICFFVTWAPYVTIVLIKAFSPSVVQPALSRFVTIWLANSNSFMNVIIYSATYSTFRNNTVRLVKRCFLTQYQLQQQQTSADHLCCERR